MVAVVLVAFGLEAGELSLVLDWKRARRPGGRPGVRGASAAVFV